MRISLNPARGPLSRQRREVLCGLSAGGLAAGLMGLMTPGPAPVVAAQATPADPL